MSGIRGVCIGAGYFSHYQYEAWQRCPEVRITAFSNRDSERASIIRNQFGIEKCYPDYREMLDREKPDFVDVITPPPTHLEICREAASRGIHIICQKPLTPKIEEAESLIESVEKAGVRFMVHENFRFQPWHREIKRNLEAGAIGNRIHSIYWRMRMGDGWGDDAYLARQPYFRDYPRLLVYETGVHFIDTFRFLLGEVKRVHAWLRRLNPVIRGEDCGLIVFEFENGAIGQWDANRFNETNDTDPRYTFGEGCLEGDEGMLTLNTAGHLFLKKLGQENRQIQYHHERRGFAGDCCYFAQRHFIDRLLEGREFETHGRDYLKTLRVQEAVYQSAQSGQPVEIRHFT